MVSKSTWSTKRRCLSRRASPERRQLSTAKWWLRVRASWLWIKLRTHCSFKVKTIKVKRIRKATQASSAAASKILLRWAYPRSTSRWYLLKIAMTVISIGSTLSGNLSQQRCTMILKSRRDNQLTAHTSFWPRGATSHLLKWSPRQLSCNDLTSPEQARKKHSTSPTKLKDVMSMAIHDLTWIYFPWSVAMSRASNARPGNPSKSSKMKGNQSTDYLSKGHLWTKLSENYSIN